MNIIDAHVHVWTDDLEHYPLAPGYSREQMQPAAFTAEQLLAHCHPAGVNRIVLVQMSYYGFDNSYMLDTMKRFPDVFGGIAVLDENAPGVMDEMDRLGEEGVRGFRVRPRQTPAGNWLDTPGYHAMLAHAAETGQSLCCLIDPDGLPSVAAICQLYPTTSLVIDHLCRIGADGTIREADVQALCALACFPNVRLKLSAFYALGRKRPPHDDLLPLFKRVGEAYQPQQLMWGSDCPFQVQSETYEDGLAPLRDYLESWSEEDREWVLRRTARRLFF